MNTLCLFNDTFLTWANV